MNFPAFGTFPSIHQFSTAVTSSSVPSSQENRYSYQTTVPVSSAPVKFRAEEMAAGVQNKYVTHYPTSSSTTAHLQYYNPPSAVSNHQSSSQNDSQPKTSYIQTSLPSATTVVTASSAELSQDITNMLLKEQSNSDQAKRVLQTTSSVADYLSHLPTSLSLHHFLKYSADAATAIKKEGVVVGQSTQLNLIPSSSSIANIIQHHPNVVQCGAGQTIVHNIATQQNAIATNATNNAPTKKKKKKKAPKEKKPKPKAGEIRLKFALDGSMLFVCPECQVAYPEKEILDQHMINHQSLERRFVCEICNAALKRKDHLTRHKQSHNPERPYLCHCLKAFKRKEQLSLHAVIHSGQKKHQCPECGKGFYRKDHLRKHTRSHIARRLKAELSQTPGANGQSPSPTANNNNNQSAGQNNHDHQELQQAQLLQQIHQQNNNC